MPATYEPIASTTLGSATGVVSFASISGTYSDLVAVITGLGATGSTLYGFRIRVNDDSASNYSNTLLAGDGSSATSNRESSVASTGISWNGIFDSTRGAVIRLHFQSYANTNVYKTILGEMAASTLVGRSVGLWRSTSAITKISFALGGGFPDLNFASGATFSLYGIKAA